MAKRAISELPDGGVQESSDVVAANRDSITKRVSLSNPFTDAYKTKVDSTATDLEAAETKNTEQDARLVTAEGDIEALENSEVADDVSALGVRVDTAEADIDTAETDIDTAEADVDALEARATTLETEVQALEDAEPVVSRVLDARDGYVAPSEETAAKIRVGDNNLAITEIDRFAEVPNTADFSNFNHFNYVGAFQI